MANSTAFDFQGSEPYISSSDSFADIALRFEQFHKNPTNVMLHLITTPLGFIGVASLLRKAFKSSSPTVTLAGIYLLSLLPELPNGIIAGTALLLFVIIQFSRALKLSVLMSVVAIVAGYMLQDVAHSLTQEPTYQSSYSAGGQIDTSNLNFWSRMFLEHCYYLLPLCVHIAQPLMPNQVPDLVKDWWFASTPSSARNLHAFAWFLGPLIMFVFGSYSIDSKNTFCFFPGVPYFGRVIRCNIAYPKEGESRKEDLKTVRDWAMDQCPPETSSSHWWYKDLPEQVKNSFSRCARASQILNMFRGLFGEEHFCIDVIDGMNEIYITGPPRFDEQANSDQVFYTRHVDGPWGVIPFVSVFRCIVGMDKNMMITTHYPLANLSVNACEGDVIGFDFNREVHYITRDDSKKDESDKFRVVLKLHYCMYPRVLKPLGWFMLKLNEEYDKLFRALFLKTINPQSMYEKFLAWQVNFQTNLFDFIETYIGQRNVFYFMLAGCLWFATGSYEVFFALTSFVHYFRYITTYYVRKDIDFGSFKRDVMLFKTVAFAQLIYHYLFPANRSNFSFDAISIAMIVSGFAVSLLATQALGIDRTYFGVELGLMKAERVNRFPYGFIPHPMIVGQILALLGFHKAEHFRAEWPHVISIHVFLYIVHMVQEHLDIHEDKGVLDTNNKKSGNNINSNEMKQKVM